VHSGQEEIVSVWTVLFAILLIAWIGDWFLMGRMAWAKFRRHSAKVDGIHRRQIATSRAACVG